jgi:uncharacterized protein YycO
MKPFHLTEMQKTKHLIFNIFFLLLFSLQAMVILLFASCEKKVKYADFTKPSHIALAKGELTDGDIIFQTNSSDFSNAIKLATHSHYSHCGVIFRWKGKKYVCEAVQPVGIKLLDDWISFGDSSHYVVKRLKNAFNILTPEACCKMVETGQSFLGKDYDNVFGWEDNRIYCSELVWKIFQRGANVEIGKLKQLKEFDLSSSLVKAELYKHYNRYIPYDEMVISPEDIFTSPLLITVKEE